MSTPTDSGYSHRQAARKRDDARQRLRRLTQCSVALVVALGGGFAALAAASTHPKKASARPAARPSRPSRPLASLAAAPAPPLIEVQRSAAAEPPAAAPTPSYAAPVAVSGGS